MTDGKGKQVKKRVMNTYEKQIPWSVQSLSPRRRGCQEAMRGISFEDPSVIRAIPRSEPAPDLIRVRGQASITWASGSSEPVLAEAGIQKGSSYQ